MILVSLTLVGHRAEPTYQWFLERFISRLGGTPFYLTTLISTGFFAYAALRRVPMALDALMAAIVAIAFVFARDARSNGIRSTANVADSGGSGLADGDGSLAPQHRTQRGGLVPFGGDRNDRRSRNERAKPFGTSRLSPHARRRAGRRCSLQ